MKKIRTFLSTRTVAFLLLALVTVPFEGQARFMGREHQTSTTPLPNGMCQVCTVETIYLFWIAVGQSESCYMYQCVSAPGFPPPPTNTSF